MKLYSKVILTAFIALTSFTAYAGDFCFSPGRSCNVQPNGGCCDNNGYLFGYGGFSFSSDFAARLLDLQTLQNNLIFDGRTPLADIDAIAPNEQLHLDSGFIIGAGAGVRSCFLGGSRFEIEGLYTENDISSIVSPAFTNAFGVAIPGRTITDLDGQFSTTAVMVNFLKEIPVGCATAYVGGGFGLATTESDVSFNGDFVSDRDFSLAHQFIVGADLPVADCLSLFLQYKLFNRGDVTLNCPSGVPGIVKTAEFEGSYQSNLVFGARFFY